MTCYFQSTMATCVRQTILAPRTSGDLGIRVRCYSSLVNSRVTQGTKQGQHTAEVIQIWLWSVPTCTGFHTIAPCCRTGKRVQFLSQSPSPCHTSQHMTDCMSQCFYRCKSSHNNTILRNPLAMFQRTCNLYVKVTLSLRHLILEY